MTAIVVALSGCAGMVQPPSVQAPARGPYSAMSVAYFYDDLSPYGRWIDYPPYGQCWTPYDVMPGWRPYTNGYWAYSDLGWAWTSYEPWGWATYHYGRWQLDPYYGWVWVPGTVWAPAWVAWRYGPDWVGWAALPPGTSFSPAVGLNSYDAARIPAQTWCFIPQRRIADSNLRYQVVSAARNPGLLDRTRDATRILVHQGRPANQGIDVKLIERAAELRVRRAPLSELILRPPPSPSRALEPRSRAAKPWLGKDQDGAEGEPKGNPKHTGKHDEG